MQKMDYNDFLTGVCVCRGGGERVTCVAHRTAPVYFMSLPSLAPSASASAALMKLAIRVYPRSKTVDEAFQRLLMDNVLPLASRCVHQGQGAVAR